jgi:AhpD family alkylhydroperoxidase
MTTTTAFALHTPASAPPGGDEALRRLHAAVGVIPNLAATMAESPELINGFLALRELYGKTGFSPAEIQVLSITAAYENDCGWCVAFHTAMALKDGVPKDAVEALRNGIRPADSRLAALSEFARAMVRGRGHVPPATVEAFHAAGYSKRQALDVVMGMGFSLLANYAAHLTHPPLDEFLKPHAWSR